MGQCGSQGEGSVRESGRAVLNQPPDCPDRTTAFDPEPCLYPVIQKGSNKNIVCMKSISLFFQVHQPLRLKTYRFFNMGRDHNYLDDSANRSIMQRVAADSYLPMNELFLKLIKANKGKFRLSFYISGIAVEQMRAYTPDVLESFRKLAETECVEFVGGTYSASLSSLVSPEEFEADVKMHSRMIKKEFGQKPTAFFNTALLYSDSIGDTVASMGFKTMLTEGARHILGWKSPNYVYANAINQKLRLLLRNYRLSDDVAFRFSEQSWNEWPLTSDKFVSWMLDEKGELINLFMDYDALGEWQKEESGIFKFIESLPKAALATKKLSFSTVSESAKSHQPIGVLYANHEVTWADEERDVTAWLGNELQKEAFRKLYQQRDKVISLASKDFEYAWRFLQTADHFYYMGTKLFSNGDLQSNSSPYPSSYEAFINYMNVLSDFINELDKAVEKKGMDFEPECIAKVAVSAG